MTILERINEAIERYQKATGSQEFAILIGLAEEQQLMDEIGEYRFHLDTWLHSQVSGILVMGKDHLRDVLRALRP